MKWAILVAATYLVQRLLGAPGMPWWAAAPLLPAVWLIVPVVRGGRPHPLALGIGAGVAWDLLMEPIVGPGGIAWSAAAIVVAWSASRFGDRRPKTWGLLGLAAAAVIVTVRHLALALIGGAPAAAGGALALRIALTGAWCWLTAAIAAANLPTRWRRLRRRRLR